MRKNTRTACVQQGRSADRGLPRTAITDPMTVYSGCYCNVSVNAYAFSVSGNRGIAMGLGNIQFLSNGESLSGKATADADFDEVEEDDDVLGDVSDEDLPDYLK